jgi:hypothetical protein
MFLLCSLYVVSQSAAIGSVPSEGEQAGTGESAEALALRPQKEDAMCHSRYWEAEEAKRKQQEAKDREAHAKRSETIKGLRADAHKQPERAPTASAPAREAAPAK